jgi:hypothetical protein
LNGYTKTGGEQREKGQGLRHKMSLPRKVAVNNSQQHCLLKSSPAVTFLLGKSGLKGSLGQGWIDGRSFKGFAHFVQAHKLQFVTILK